MLAHTQQYSKIINRYMVRQFVKPGISGWAQVNGWGAKQKRRYLWKNALNTISGTWKTGH